MPRDGPPECQTWIPVAVIDAAGSYTVTVNAQPSMHGLVLSRRKRGACYDGNWSLPAPVEVRSGQLALAYNNSLNLNQALVNQGTIQLYSRDVNTYLAGNGWVENRGLVQVSSVGANGGQAQIRVPIGVTGTGRLLVATNGSLAFYGGSGVTSSGIIEVQDGGRAFYVNESPEHDLTVMAGSQLIGAGFLQFYGNNELVMAGNAATTLFLELHDNAQVLGPGVLTLETSQTLQGLYGCPLVISDGVSMGVNGAIVSDWVTVESNAVLFVNYNQALTLNSVLTNLGTLQLYSRDVNSYLNGSGRVENRALMQVSTVGANGGQAQIRVPVNVTGSGRVLLTADAWMAFYAGSSLVSAEY